MSKKKKGSILALIRKEKTELGAIYPHPWGMFQKDYFRRAHRYKSSAYIYSTIFQGELTKWTLNGNVIWGKLLPTDTPGHAVVSLDGSVYVTSGVYQSDQAQLHKFLSNGTKEWSITLSGSSAGVPAIGIDGNIYVLCNSGELFSIDPSGAVNWNISLFSSDITTLSKSPLIDKYNNIYVTMGTRELYSISSDGTINWVAQYGGGYNTHAYDPNKDVIYTTGYKWSYGDTLYAVKPDGTLEWELYLGGSAITGICIGYSGIVIIPSSSTKKLYAIDPSGNFIWSYQANDNFSSSPAILSDGTIIVHNNNGYLYAIKPDGTLRWKKYIGLYYRRTPAVDNNDYIYVSYGDWSTRIVKINRNGTIVKRFLETVYNYTNGFAIV